MRDCASAECPLYVAAHDPETAGAGCDDGDLAGGRCAAEMSSPLFLRGLEPRPVFVRGCLTLSRLASGVIAREVKILKKIRAGRLIGCRA